MRIAITGGSGRLGSYIRRALVAHELRVLDRTPPTDPVTDFRPVDVRDLDGLVAALEGSEVVVHQDCARGFALAAMSTDYAGYETFFLAADDAFSDQPTVMRLEGLYGAPIPVRDPALYAKFPCASPVSNARARVRLGWLPTTRWSGTAITAP